MCWFSRLATVCHVIAGVAAASPDSPSDQIHSMEKHVGIKALKKKFQIEPFFSGSDDKRTDRVEILPEQELVFCSFKRRSRDVRIVDLRSARILQSIPPHIKFTASTKDEDEDKNTFLQTATKKKSDEEDAAARDHVITFAVRCQPGAGREAGVRVITAHSSYLMKEWIVQRSRTDINVSMSEQEEGSEVRVVLKQQWQSFHKSPVSILKFSIAPADGYVASGGSSDSTVKVWDVDNGRQTHNFKLGSGVISVIAFHNRKVGTEDKYYLMASGELTPKIHIYDLKTNQDKVLDGHISAVTALVPISDKMMVSASRDKILIFWDLKSMTAIRKIPVFESVEDMILFTMSANEVLIVVGEEGKIKVLDSTTGRLIGSFPASNCTTSQPAALKQVIPVGSDLVTASYENHLNFHTVDGTKLRTERMLVGELDQVLAVKFVGNKCEHLLVASNSAVIKIYSLCEENSSCQVVHGHTDIILSVHVFSYDRDLFMTGSKDNTIRIWKFLRQGYTFNAACLAVGTGHLRSVTSVVAPGRLSSDFIASGSEDCIVNLWKLPDSIHDQGVQASHQPVTMTSVASIKAHEKDVNSISVSPNDLMIGTGSRDKTCKIWSMDHKSDQLSCLATLRGHRKTVWSTDFSPIDKVILTASGDCSIKIWSLGDYSCIRTFCVNNSSVYLFAKFISNGTQIASSSSDSLVKVWSVRTTEPVLTLDPLLHTEIISELTLNKFKSVKSKVPNGENPEEEEEDDLRVWTLDFDTSQNLLTFGSGSRVFVYQDNTQTAETAMMSLRDEQVQTDQKLKNLLQRGNYEKALKVAITLDQPFRCLDILRQITLSTEDRRKSRRPNYDLSDDEDSGKATVGLERLHVVLSELRCDQLLYLLKHAAFRWNTNAKNCWIAQVVMKTCLPRLIRELCDKDFEYDLTQMQSMIEAMISYSERHYARIKKLGVSSHFVQFLSQNVMKSLPVQDLSLNEATQEPELEIEIEPAPVLPEANVLTEAQHNQSANGRSDPEDEYLSSGEETEGNQRLILGEGDRKKSKGKKNKKIAGGKNKKTKLRTHS